MSYCKSYGVKTKSWMSTLILLFLTLPLITLLAGCGTTVSSCSIDTGLIVDSRGVERPSDPVDNEKLLRAIRGANDERDVDNVRKAQLRKQVDACVTGGVR